MFFIEKRNDKYKWILWISGYMSVYLLSVSECAAVLGPAEQHDSPGRH